MFDDNDINVSQNSYARPSKKGRVKKIQLFFSAKDDALPVQIELRPMVNGFPSSSIILPFSEVTLNPDKDMPDE